MLKILCYTPPFLPLLLTATSLFSLSSASLWSQTISADGSLTNRSNITQQELLDFNPEDFSDENTITIERTVVDVPQTTFDRRSNGFPEPSTVPTPTFDSVSFPKNLLEMIADLETREKENRNQPQQGFYKKPEPEPVSETQPIVKRSLYYEDPNYESLGWDIRKSSLPVNRSRILSADRYITAILDNAIDTDQPGRFIAVVERHVFAAEGRNILIPKGSRIICSSQRGGAGSAKISASCARLIRPDGVGVNISGFRVADSIGRVGITGAVDNRYFERFSAIFLLDFATAVTSGVNTAVRSVTSRTLEEVFDSEIAETENGQAATNVTEEMVNEAVKQGVRIHVPAGTRISILPSTDIEFIPYREQ